MRKLAEFSLLAALLTGPVLAQQTPDEALYDRALAAGYKAQFLCSGLWNGGKSVEQIEADELTGIYDNIAGIVPVLKADIDTNRHRVRVTFDDHAPPREAIWTRDRGCTSLPLFGSAETRSVPANSERAPPGSFDELPWPLGDIAPAVRTDRSITTVRNVVAGAFQAPAAQNGKTSAVIVVRGGRIIAEQYVPGFNMHTGQRTWSVAKSIAGTLVGYAVQHGKADVRAPAAIPEWQTPGDPRRAITLDNLMRMTSGLYSDTAGNRTDPVYMGGTAVAQRTTSWPLLHTPGSQFRYANNDIMLAAYALRTQDAGFDPNTLFQKIGMTRTYAETDWQGNYILSSQVWTTARDLARLGLLYLENGEWSNGEKGSERLLPANWREYVSTPSGPQPDGIFGYGATFWLMNKSAGIPNDTFAGFGNRGQYLVIIPSLDLVIVRRGYDTAANRFDIEQFTRAIVAASQ